jgi:hypothetical protein
MDHNFRSDPQTRAARRLGAFVVVLLGALLVVLTLGRGDREVHQQEQVAVRLLRQGLDGRDPALVVQARDAFLDASSGPFLRSDALLLANVADLLHARLLDPDARAERGGHPAVEAALDLLAHARYEAAVRTLDEALEQTPDSPVLRFYASLARDLDAAGRAHP